MTPSETTQDVTREVGDFIIKRRDDVFAYQLAVVVDDICMGITDVVRGEDLFLNTPRQLSLYRALGAEAPRFWHVPLVLSPDGSKLSKRDRAHGIRGICEGSGQGVGAIWGALALELGWIKKRGSITPYQLLERLECGGGVFDRWKDSMRALSV